MLGVQFSTLRQFFQTNKLYIPQGSIVLRVRTGFIVIIKPHVQHQFLRKLLHI